jgi:sortase A
VRGHRDSSGCTKGGVTALCVRRMGDALSASGNLSLLEHFDGSATPGGLGMAQRKRRILLLSQFVFIVTGLSLLAYCAIVRIEARRYQTWAHEQLRESSSVPDVPPVSARFSTPALLYRNRAIGFLGRVDVPRIHLSAMIAEGATARVLDLAAGHVPGTSWPGQDGNTALAAHRDTFFRRLGELETGDVIHVTVPRAVYTYRVTFTDIVKPDETWVLQRTSGQILTLITCYPFHFVGSAPKRFIVRARRLDLNQDGTAPRSESRLPDAVSHFTEGALNTLGLA